MTQRMERKRMGSLVIAFVFLFSSFPQGGWAGQPLAANQTKQQSPTKKPVPPQPGPTGPIRNSGINGIIQDTTCSAVLKKPDLSLTISATATMRDLHQGERAVVEVFDANGKLAGTGSLSKSDGATYRGWVFLKGKVSIYSGSDPNTGHIPTWRVTIYDDTQQQDQNGNPVPAVVDQTRLRPLTTSTLPAPVWHHP